MIYLNKSVELFIACGFPLKCFLSDFVEFEHNEEEYDFTKIPQYNNTGFVEVEVKKWEASVLRNFY